MFACRTQAIVPASILRCVVARVGHDMELAMVRLEWWSCLCRLASAAQLRDALENIPSVHTAEYSLSARVGPVQTSAVGR